MRDIGDTEPPPSSNSAIEVLAERFARDEIDSEELAERRGLLKREAQKS